MNTTTISKLPKQGDIPDYSVSPVLAYYNSSIYVLYSNITVDANTSQATKLHRYNMNKSSWEFIAEFSKLKIYSGCLIEHHLFFNTDSNLYRLDLITYRLLKLGGSSNLTTYAIACSQNEIYAYSSSIKSTNLLVEFDLNNDRTNFSIISYNDFSYPKVRLSHSLNQINNQLYLFGGENKGKFFGDIWIYNPQLSSWTAGISQGASPTGRSNHAAASCGNLLLIWGGEDVSGYLSDMYLYNTLQAIWTEIIPSSNTLPSDRAGACAVYDINLAYIFGGITTYGVSGELWKFDFSSNMYTLVSKYQNSGVSYPNCQLNHNIFSSLCGSDNNGNVFSYHLAFDLVSNTWTSTHLPNCYIQGVDLYMENYTINFGGRYFNKNSSNLFNIQNGNITKSFSLDYNVYNSGFVLLGSVIYFLYGGSGTVYGNLDYNTGSIVFGTIDMAYISTLFNKTLLCSPGFYSYNFRCYPCPAGTYSSNLGNCTKCGLGTYNTQTGSTSFYQCFPCPYGTFTNQLGSSVCLNCPAGYVCEIGAYNPRPFSYIKSPTSIQPSNYFDPDYSSTLLKLQIFLGAFFGILILVIYGLARHKIKIFDIYNDKHTYKYGDAVILKETVLGGLFSLFFFCLSLVIIANILIQYSLENTTESKALQPLPILQLEVDSFLADIKIVVTFNAYGDSCSQDDQCSPGIYFQVSDFKITGNYSFKCELVEIACVITFMCLDCEITSGSSVYFYLNELLSHASSITVNLTSDSSIPGFISSETANVSADENQLFIGLTPTKFYFSLTPSLFVSSVLGYTKNTGYHVLVDSIPIPGSQYTIPDSQAIRLLGVVVYLSQSSSGLYTLRYPTQNFTMVLSGVLGAVSGLMQALAFIMRKLENRVNNFYQGQKNKSNFLGIKKKRTNLINELKTEPNRIEFKEVAKKDSTCMIKF